MINLLGDLKKIWAPDWTKGEDVNDDQISLFEDKYNVLLPDDLKQYFKVLNGTNGEYDEYFYCFNSFSQFKNIEEELGDWSGIPNYLNLKNTLTESDRCFVFCDYQFHVYSYAVRLYDAPTDNNEIYALCGDQYRIIADSFTDFLVLYLSQSEKLYF